MGEALQISIEADAVRNSIAENVLTASIELAEFSRRYARTAKYKNAALAIRANIPGFDDPSLDEDLRSRMADILDNILSEYANEDVETAQVLHAKKRLFARFRREPLVQKTICQTLELEMHFPSSNFVMGPISLELKTGEITALVSENAHGKTTLLRTLTGEYCPTKGSIAFPSLSKRKKLSWPTVKQKIGYLPQKLPDWHASLSDTLYFEAALHGLAPDESEMHVQYLIARLDLGEYINQKWTELSGGYQLRFSLAKVLASRPQLLVLDEPLANLDPKAQAALLWDIRHLAKSVQSPMAVLISSQVLNPMEEISDNVIFLKKGKVTFQGPTMTIGAERTHNLYECDTSLGLDVLRRRIRKHILDIKHNGVYYIISTPLEVSYRDMLLILSEADVEFTHFRDIGRKAMGFFERD